MMTGVGSCKGVQPLEPVMLCDRLSWAVLVVRRKKEDKLFFSRVRHEFFFLYIFRMCACVVSVVYMYT